MLIGILDSISDAIEITLPELDPRHRRPRRTTFPTGFPLQWSTEEGSEELIRAAKHSNKNKILVIIFDFGWNLVAHTTYTIHMLYVNLGHGWGNSICFIW